MLPPEKIPSSALAPTFFSIGFSIALSAVLTSGLVGCGSGDPPAGIDPDAGSGGSTTAAAGGRRATGTGGSTSRGGNGAAASGGATGSGGSTSGGAPGAGVGGSSDTGGVGGAAAAGGAGGTSGGDGSGGSSSLCGNHNIDPGEQCDDGNSTSEDDCTSLCTDNHACEKCVTNNCTADVAGGCPALATTYVNPDHSDADPATRQKAVAACERVLNCALRTECAITNSDVYCYCGATDIASCKSAAGNAQGPCRQEIDDVFAAFPSSPGATDPTSIVNNIGLLTTPHGAALALARCEWKFCGAPPDPGNVTTPNWECSPTKHLKCFDYPDYVDPGSETYPPCTTGSGGVSGSGGNVSSGGARDAGSHP